MRLIDAEHLINKAEKEKKDGLLEDDELETIYYELSDEPTVDAIPIEWLIEKYQIDGMCGTETYFRKAYAVHEIIEYWRMENEGK